MKPAPQGVVPHPAASAELPAVLWGRVYPGRRWWERSLGRALPPAGRHEAGPTGCGTAPAASAELPAVVGPGLSRPTVVGTRPWPSLPARRPAGKKPAPQGVVPPPAAPADFDAVLWGRVYPGRRRWERSHDRAFPPAGRHEAGPTGCGTAPAASAELLLFCGTAPCRATSTNCCVTCSEIGRAHV